MLNKEKCLVVTFDRTVDAMAFEEYCLSKKIVGRIIPLPKSISASCGLSWKTNTSMYKEMEEAIANSGIKNSNILEIEI